MLDSSKGNSQTRHPNKPLKWQCPINTLPLSCMIYQRMQGNVVVKRNRFLAETPKPEQGSWINSISAETASFGRNVLFRPEQYMVLHQIFGQNRGLNMFFLAKRDYTLFRPQKDVLAVDFILKCASKIGGNKVFRPKQAVLSENSVLAKTPKWEKTEIETETGRNFLPKPPNRTELFRFAHYSHFTSKPPERRQSRSPRPLSPLSRWVRREIERALLVGSDEGDRRVTFAEKE